MSKKVIPECKGLSDIELDEKLAEAVVDSQRAERLICFYLLEMAERRGYEKFGYKDVWDYASARFGYSSRKTHYFLGLAHGLKRLPKLLDALENGEIGWTKAYQLSRIAEPETEEEWIEKAKDLSVRDLKETIQRRRTNGGRPVKLWMTQEMAELWDFAIEVCRMSTGAQHSRMQCLEFMIGEFLSTWSYEANRHVRLVEETAEEAENGDSLDSTSNEDLTEEETLQIEKRLCPDNDDLPAAVLNYRCPPGWMEIIERDSYQCCYPGCGARSGLHPHHIEFRNRFGTKTRAERDAPSNQVTVCALHHRMLHSGVISVKGRAPDQLDWREPDVMVAAMRRLKEDFLRSLEEKDREIRVAAESEPRPEHQEEEENSVQTFAQESMQTFAFQSTIFGGSNNPREANQSVKTPSGTGPPTLFRDNTVP
jgi:hypothetical protein